MKEIRVKSKSLGFEGTVREFGGDNMVLVVFDDYGAGSHWLPEADLHVLMDAKEIEEWLDNYINNTFLIDVPEGLPYMSRQVRLVVGEGDDKREIGVADVQPVQGEHTKVVMKITDPQIARMLGGDQVIGVIPRYVEPPSEPQQPSEGQEKASEEPTND